MAGAVVLFSSPARAFFKTGGAQYVNPPSVYTPISPRFVPPGSNDTAGVGSPTWAQSKMVFTASGLTNNFQIDFYGFILEVNSGVDTSLVNYTVNALLEYPSNTFTPFTWSSSSSKVIASGSNSNQSDILTLGAGVPAGATYAIHTQGVGSSFCLACSNRRFGSDAWGTGTGTPPSLGTSYANTTGTGTMFAPNMVTGTQGPSLPLIAFWGDSNLVDQANITDAAGIASWPRAIDAIATPYKFCCSGNDLYVVAGHFAHRLAVLEKYSAARCMLAFGTNDLFNGQTDTQLIANADILVNSLAAAGITPHFFTVPPCQQPPLGEAYRLSFNAYLRNNSNVGNYGKTFEVADIVETARDSGTWKANYSFGGTGVHFNWPDATIRGILLSAFSTFYASL